MMVNGWIFAIISGITTTMLYELGKYLFFYLCDRRKEGSLEFSIAGYWCTYVTQGPEKGENAYSACELIKLRCKKGYVTADLFQLTNDARKYYYKGIGFFKGDKIVIAYGDSTTKNSNHVGTMVLRFQNVLEHQVWLVGNYHEFQRNGYRSKSIPYKLKQYQGKEKISAFKRALGGRKYIYSFMDQENFKNECKKVSEMR